MSYHSTITALEALVATVGGSYKIYPIELLENVDDETFLTFDLIFSSGTRNDYTNSLIDGTIIFTVVYPYTMSKRTISSYLETYLSPVFSNKVLSSAKLQTFTSSLQFIRSGTPDNTKLRAEYSVPFKYIGE